MERINKFWKDNSQEEIDWLEGKQIHGYGGYLFLLFIEGLSLKGYLPISQDAAGDFYYDLDCLGNRLKQENCEETNQILQYFQECLQSEEICMKRVDYYVIVRNFMFAVAEIYLGYYKEASPLVTELSHAVEELFEVSADVDNSEKWRG